MAKKQSAPKKEVAAGRRPGRTFDDLLAGHTAPLREVCGRLRDLVTATLPGAVEGVYGGAKVGVALYAVGGGKTVVCGIQPSGDDCLFYLHHLKPEDSPRLKLEGRGKHALHVRVTTLDDATGAELVSLVQLALSRC
jgi:hypothetical protein